MKQKNKSKDRTMQKGHHQHPLPGEITPEQKKQNENALQEAEKDMQQDADISAHNKNDDLDESETARLGEEKTGLV
jgi:hypothetical protein